MTIQQLKQYVKDKRKAKAKQWAKEKAIHGECKPFTLKEYLKHQDIIIAGKRSYKTKFVHNKLWTITR
tara:strand:- start:948 stop:1151 length:204 start_codon:yes stop_codon:yes gene_type:complete